jgi:pilus assembly protein Flp/PilA
MEMSAPRVQVRNDRRRRCTSRLAVIERIPGDARDLVPGLPACIAMGEGPAQPPEQQRVFSFNGRSPARYTEVAMLQYVKSLLRDERGVSSLEYAVLAGIVVVALAAVGVILSSTSGGLPSVFTTLINKVTSLI